MLTAQKKNKTEEVLNFILNIRKITVVIKMSLNTSISTLQLKQVWPNQYFLINDIRSKITN